MFLISPIQNEVLLSIRGTGMAIGRWGGDLPTNAVYGLFGMCSVEQSLVLN
jgi:hypothetical protein